MTALALIAIGFVFGVLGCIGAAYIAGLVLIRWLRGY